MVIPTSRRRPQNQPRRRSREPGRRKAECVPVDNFSGRPCSGDSVMSSLLRSLILLLLLAAGGAGCNKIDENEAAYKRGNELDVFVRWQVAMRPIVKNYRYEGPSEEMKKIINEFERETLGGFLIPYPEAGFMTEEDRRACEVWASTMAAAMKKERP